jgi:uncharacterized protein (TIGR00369 family)
MSLTDANLTPMIHPAQNRCFGCGAANPIGLQLEFFIAPDGSIHAEKTVGDSYEGPPGLVHGGMIATLLDEVMSKTVRALGIRAVTRKMEVEYLKPVHSQTLVRLVATLVKKDGRKHWTEGRLLDAAGTILAQGTALFIEIREQSGNGVSEPR